MHAASDIALGAVLVATGAVALAFVEIDLGRPSRLGPGFFPTAVALAMLVAGAAAWLRAALLRGQQDARWSFHGASIIGAIAGVSLTAWWWLGEYTPQPEAPEWAAILALLLAAMVVLSRLSRVRAAGIALLGLLLGIVGTDINTGVQRMMFGFDSLADGLSIRAALIGFLVADAALCAASPSLLLASYARKFGLQPTASGSAPLLRAAGVLAIGAGLYAAEIHADADLIGQLALFIALGLACQLLDWNRLVFLAAFVIAPLLEESLQHTALLARGDASFLWTRPVAVALFLAAVTILGIAIALSARRRIRAAHYTP